MPLRIRPRVLFRKQRTPAAVAEGAMQTKRQEGGR